VQDRDIVAMGEW